jgi:hypothetical protein
VRITLSYRTTVVTSAFLFSAATVQAQTANTTGSLLTAGAVLHTAVSRAPDAESVWNGKTARSWKNWTTGAWTLLKVDGTTSLYRNSVNDVRFDASSFANTATSLYKEHQILEQTGQRPSGPLQAGQQWKSSVRYIASPANWCSDLEVKLTGDFEVLAAEPYTLKIDEQEVTLQVNPVVRRGYWQRCYTGPQTQRFVWSPELGVLLALELLTYDPANKLDPYSYSMRVTSIDRNSPK